MGNSEESCLLAGKTNSRVNAALVSPNKAYKQDLKGSDYFQITASKEKKPSSIFIETQKIQNQQAKFTISSIQ